MVSIDFVYGSFSCGSKQFDFTNLFDDSQGLTGSEISCFLFAKTMAKRGHQVSLYTQIKNDCPTQWEGVSVIPLSQFGHARKPPEVFYSWNETNMLQFTPKSSLRMMNMQLNDMPYCDPVSFDSVDAFTSVSPSHRDYITQFTPGHEKKWEIIANCIEPSLFDLSIPKKKGKMIYCSSPDRGLHLLLQEYPKIKEKCPWVSLHIFYPFDRWYNSLQDINESSSPIWQEFKHRGDYIKYALNEMKTGFDIHHHQGVSVNRMHKEICEADVAPYPVSCPTFTEGFSVSGMQFCYGKAFPVLSIQDSIGQIYQDSGCPIVKTPTTQHMSEFREHTIRALTDKKWANEIREKTHKFAQEYTFEKETVKLEQLIERKLIEKQNQS